MPTIIEKGGGSKKPGLGSLAYQVEQGLGFWEKGALGDVKLLGFLCGCGEYGLTLYSIAKYTKSNTFL